MSGARASGWRIEPVPVLADNYAWALHDDTHAVIVDPGEGDPVLAWLDANRLSPIAVLLTHHHPDHVGGLPALKQRWPDLVAFAPHDARIDAVDHRVAGKQTIAPGRTKAQFDVVAIPGHTLSHVAFHGHGAVFCGDTLFSAGCGRLFEGTPAQMLASLDALAALPPETLVCCGHEYTRANCAFAAQADPDNEDLRRHAAAVDTLRSQGRPSLPSTLALERRINPFLRIDTPGVRRALVARRSLDPAASRIEAFAALRAWKDDDRA